MKLERDFHYDAPPDVVVAMMGSREFQEEKCRNSGALDWDIEIEGDDAMPVIRTRRTMPTDGLPDLLKSVVRNGITLRETTTFEPSAATDGSRTASLVVEFVGQPLKMKATVVLTPANGGTDGRFTAELKATVPFIGGKIEKGAASQVSNGVKTEVRTGQAYLAERA